jgi:hypothetical protein
MGMRAFVRATLLACGWVAEGRNWWVHYCEDGDFTTEASMVDAFKIVWAGSFHRSNVFPMKANAALARTVTAMSGDGAQAGYPADEPAYWPKKVAR